MTPKLLLILSFILFIHINAQQNPESFSLPGDKNYLPKTTSSSPVSNSILDIITLGDTVWLGTSRGVSVSYDGGSNWTNFYGTPAFGEDDISALTHNKYDGSIWAATATTADAPGGGTVPKGTGLKYTTDKGLTWNSLPQPVDNPDSNKVIYGIDTLNALPVTVTEQNLTYDIAFTPNAVWIASFAAGLRRSTDMGQSWERVVIPPDALDSIKATDTLDFCLSPVAGNICGEGNLNHRAFAVIAANDSTLYIGTANGINKTTNADDRFPSWTKFNHQNQDNPISGNFITALGFNPPNTIWASTWKAEDPLEFYGVSSSTDGGMSWEVFLQDERPHNFGFKNDQVIAATDNGAFRSSDQGLTWILPNNIVDSKSGISLRTTEFYSASSSGNDVWLGSDAGLARITETGFWQGNWKVYFASQPLKSDKETYCFPNPFSPRISPFTLNFRYSTGGEFKDVTIRIYDFGMNYIRTVIQNAQRHRTRDDGFYDSWDGRDDNGNLLPNGVYFYRVDIDNEEPLFGKIIYLQ